MASVKPKTKKKASPKKAKETVEAVEAVEVEAVETPKEAPVQVEQVEGTLTDATPEGFDSMVSENPLFTVRLDSKKIEKRTPEQVSALVFGSLGSVKKIIIDEELQA